MTAGVRAFIGVGSNIEPERHIPAALERLSGAAPLVGISTFYRTAPIDRPDQDWYLNGVVAAEWHGSATVLKMEVLRSIEADLGRVRGEDLYAARCIDLDLLMMGDAVIKTPELILPDPDITTRPFLIAGLLELAPDLVMPDCGRPLSDWARTHNEATLEAAHAFTEDLRERFLRHE